MERENEIKILIDYLKNEVLKESNFPNLLLDTIINNGKLIESYRIELEQIKNK